MQNGGTAPAAGGGPHAAAPDQKSALEVPELPIGRYRLTFQSSEPVSPGGFTGSAWRGVFGHALRRLACVTQLDRCEPCLLNRSCVYSYVFETPPPPDSRKLPDYTAAPHPFVFVVPEGQDPMTSRLGLTLFGRGNQYLAYLVLALRSAAEKGLRKAAPPMQLQAVEQEDAPGSGQWCSILEPQGALAPLPVSVARWPACPAEVRLDLLTPLRLRVRNSYVTPATFTFAHLFSNLLRRISLLTFFHTDRPLETGFSALVQASRSVQLSALRLHWKEWTRYSSRQQTRLQMGGIVGSVSISGAPLEPFWPYLWLGQWTHAGKGTSMGLGRYQLIPG